MGTAQSVKLDYSGVPSPASGRILLIFMVLFTLILPVSAGAGELYDKGVRLLREQRFDDAMAVFHAALETGPPSARLYNSMGVCRFYTGDLNGAIDDYTKAVQLDPADPEPLKNRGGAWFYLKAYDNAVEDYSQAVRIDPEDPNAYYHRGVALYFKGDFAASISDHRRVLQLRPDHAAALNQIAWTLATCPEEKLRDGKTAVELAEKAMALQPDVQYLDTLAAAYAAAGRFEEAAASQLKVMQWLKKAGKKEALAESGSRLDSYRAGRIWTTESVVPCDRKKITDFVHEWRDTWASANLTAYGSYYHPSARQGSIQGRSLIVSGKKRLWRKKHPVKILLGSIRIERDQGQCVASFSQTYSASDGYRDKGVKTLLLSPYGHRWLILKESWRETP